MGFDDVKIMGLTASLFLPVIAQAVHGDMPAWVLVMKELGSVVAVIYLFYYTLSRALPAMQSRFEAQLQAEREENRDCVNRILDILEAQIGTGSEES